MIQIRKPDGNIVPVPGEGNFVELINDMDGKVMMVFVQLKPGTILRISPGSNDAMRYQEIFSQQGVKFVESVIVRDDFK